MASIREIIARELKGWPGVEARVREELVEPGKAQLHHVLPQTGWIGYYLSGVARRMSPGRLTCSSRITTV